MQLPSSNTKDNPDVLDQVKKPARLDLRMVYPFATPQTAPGDIPPGYEVKTYDREPPNGTEASEEFYVKRIPEMTGEAISYSAVQRDSYGKPIIGLHFHERGGPKAFRRGDAQHRRER